MNKKTGMNIIEFIKILKLMMNRSDSDWNILPEAAIHEDSENVKTPLITYGIKSRKSSDNSTRKPSYKKESTNNNQKSSNIIEYSQRFICLLEFGFYHKSYIEANKLRDKFEDFIIDYTGHFRKEGIVEIVFEEQLRDEGIKIKEQFFSKQSVIYRVENEKIRTVKQSKITKIDAKARNSLEPDSLLYIKNKLNTKDNKEE